VFYNSRFLFGEYKSYICGINAFIMIFFSVFFVKVSDRLPCFNLSNNQALKLGMGDKLDNSCTAGNSVMIPLATSFIR